MKRMESNLILEFLWGYSRIFNVEITGAWHASVMIIRGIEYFRDKKTHIHQMCSKSRLRICRTNALLATTTFLAWCKIKSTTP